MSNSEKKKWDIIKTENGKPRISQACDRCCIKKIKCDGLPGGCTNCLKIGFFCKTTDKAIRSSFPKGYTKSLEMQVVELELQNNKMKLAMENLEKDLSMMKSSASSNGLDASAAEMAGAAIGVCNSVSADRDDDFFNFNTDFLATAEELQLRPRQELHGDYLSFDQLKVSPLAESLATNYGICAEVAEMTNEVERNVDLKYMLTNYVKPLLHKDPNVTESLFNDNKIDALISNFFQYHNKLIPVLDLKKFCNQYLNFFNKFNDVVEKDEIDSITEFDEHDSAFIMKLLLVIKFNFNNVSVFNKGNDDYKVFSFYTLQSLMKFCNFAKPTLDNFEVMLMMLSYMYHFEIPMKQFQPAGQDQLSDWCYELLSLSLHYVNSMGLNINTNSIIVNQQTFQDQESLIQYNFIRLKLYWSFRILLRSIKIEFNYNYKNLKMMKEQFPPDPLESVFVFEKSLKYTTALLSMIKLVPINFMELTQFEMEKVELELDLWLDSFKATFPEPKDTEEQDQDAILAKDLLSIYHHYKFIINKEKIVNEVVDNCYDKLDSLLTYEVKPKVTRGRKKRNYHEMMEQQAKLQNKVNLNQVCLVSKLSERALNEYEKLKLNEKLSCASGNFINLCLVALLHDVSNSSQSITQDGDKLKKFYQIFTIGLIDKTPWQADLLEKVSQHMAMNNTKLMKTSISPSLSPTTSSASAAMATSPQQSIKTIDISKEFNDLHQSFMIHASHSTDLPPSPTNTSTNSEFSFNMSRNSSMSTAVGGSSISGSANPGSIFMSRTPSLKQPQSYILPSLTESRTHSVVDDDGVNIKVEVESLFGNFGHNNNNKVVSPSSLHHHNNNATTTLTNQRHGQRANTASYPLYKDDEDLLRLKQKVLNLSK